MATEKWVAGTVGLTWVSAGFSTELNALGAGNAVVAASALVNGSNLDMFCDVSISLGSVTPATGTPVIGIYLFPLNQDGSSYGNGAFASAAVGPPDDAYKVANILAQASVAGVVTGCSTVPILMPPGSFKFCLYNGLGVALAGSANAVNYRTYNLAIA